jgi:hypothetical protein
LCTMRLIKPIDIYNEAQRLRFEGNIQEYKLYLKLYKERTKNVY